MKLRLVPAAPNAFNIPVQTIGEISPLVREPLCHLQIGGEPRTSRSSDQWRNFIAAV
jgi:hypothetical protein